MSSDGDSEPNVSAKIGKAAYILQRLRPTQAKGPTIAGYQLIEGKSSVCDLYGIYMIIIRIITYQHGSNYRILQTWKHIMHARTHARTHVLRRRLSGCRFSRGHWRPTVTQLSVACSFKYKHSRGRHGFREFLGVFRIYKMLPRPNREANSRMIVYICHNYGHRATTIDLNIKSRLYSVHRHCDPHINVRMWEVENRHMIAHRLDVLHCTHL